MKNSIQLFTFSTLILSLSAMAYESYFVGSTDESGIITLEVSEDMGEEGEEIQRQIKEHGYYPTYSENAKSLIAFKDKKGFPISNHEDPYFAILRLNLSDFPLSFPFKGISSVDDIHLLGFAPGMSFEKGSWTGVTAFFLNDHFGVCRLNVSDVSLGGQSIYDSRYTTYDINEKPTTKVAEGSKESGFLYTVTWSGKRYDNLLECANSKPFDKRILEDLVTYAKKIDKDLPDTP